MKLLIEETGSETAEQAWFAADVRLCCTVGFPEASAAISRAWRMRRIESETAHVLLEDLTDLWLQITRIQADDELARDAAQCAVLFGLRGYDAMHLAAVRAPQATLVAADGQLLVAARKCGLATIDVTT